MPSIRRRPDDNSYLSRLGFLLSGIHRRVWSADAKAVYRQERAKREKGYSDEYENAK